MGLLFGSSVSHLHINLSLLVLNPNFEIYYNVSSKFNVFDIHKL